MSDKPEQKKGWFQRLTSGLTRSSQAMTDQVTGVFTKKPLDQEQLDALEEMLIEADLGPQIAARITEAFGVMRSEAPRQIAQTAKTPTTRQRKD